MEAVSAQSDFFDELGTPERPRNPLEARFWIFHAENPRVYELFHKFAMMMVRKGLTDCSADMIMHRVRFETALETTETMVIEGRRLKLSNNHVAYYARLWMRDHPEYKGFFKLRTLLNGKASERLEEE